MAHQPVLSSLTQGVPLPPGSGLVPKISQIKTSQLFYSLKKEQILSGPRGRPGPPEYLIITLPSGTAFFGRFWELIRSQRELQPKRIRHSFLPSYLPSYASTSTGSVQPSKTKI